MSQEPEKDHFDRELYPAGQRVPAGRYKNIDGTNVLVLDQEDFLPADLDGHATSYTRIEIWSDIQPTLRPS